MTRTFLNSGRFWCDQCQSYSRNGLCECEQHINICPKCGGQADNGHDRCIPPNPYYCSKCTSAQKNNKEEIPI